MSTDAVRAWIETMRKVEADAWRHIPAPMGVFSIGYVEDEKTAALRKVLLALAPMLEVIEAAIPIAESESGHNADAERLRVTLVALAALTREPGR